MARRILAAFLGVVAILAFTADRLSGETTTTRPRPPTTTAYPSGFFAESEPPTPLSLYARRPGAKYEDVEARPPDTINLGPSKLRLVDWSIAPHAAIPGVAVPARIAKYEKVDLADRYVPITTNTTGDLLVVDIRMTFPVLIDDVTLPVALSCVATAADDGAVLVPYDQPPPPPATNTSSTTKAPPVEAKLFFPLGEHRGRLYLTCRNTFFDAGLSTTRAVWGIDV